MRDFQLFTKINEYIEEKANSISQLFGTRVVRNETQNDDVYNNSPVHYLSGMSNDHYYINMYNQRRIIIVVGQGDWEHLVYYSNEWIDKIEAYFYRLLWREFTYLCNKNNIRKRQKLRKQKNHHLKIYKKV